MSEKGKQFQRTEDGNLILVTPEERMLLIKELTARIEYGVICMIERVDDFGPIHRYEKLTGFTNEEKDYFYFDFNYGMTVDFAEKVKPCLRSIQNLTEEEQFQLGRLIGAASYNMLKGDYSSLKELLEYVYKNHIDLFGLIPKGLALEAIEGMYNLKL